MLERIKNSACNFAHNVQHACTSVKNQCETFGRKVTRITREQLIEPAKASFERNAPSFPTTAILTPFGILGIGALAAGIALIGTSLLENRGNQKTCENIYRGIRNFCVLGSGIEAIRSIATLNPFFLINIPCYLFIATIADSHLAKTPPLVRIIA